MFLPFSSTSSSLFVFVPPKVDNREDTYDSRNEAIDSQTNENVREKLKEKSRFFNFGENKKNSRQVPSDIIVENPEEESCVDSKKANVQRKEGKETSNPLRTKAASENNAEDDEKREPDDSSEDKNKSKFRWGNKAATEEGKSSSRKWIGNSKGDKKNKNGAILSDRSSSVDELMSDGSDGDLSAPDHFQQFQSNLISAMRRFFDCSGGNDWGEGLSGGESRGRGSSKYRVMRNVKSPVQRVQRLFS